MAGRRLARCDSPLAGFVAAGVQARFNLRTLIKLFPIEQAVVYDVDDNAAMAFVAYAAQLGIEARVVSQSRSAVAGTDIIVTSAPSIPGGAFLDLDWVSPGAFVSMVDLARSWLSGIEKFDRIATDGHEQTKSQFAEGRLVFRGSYDSDLGQLIAGNRPSCISDSERTAIIHPGHVVGTLALAALSMNGLERAGEVCYYQWIKQRLTKSRLQSIGS